MYDFDGEVLYMSNGRRTANGDEEFEAFTCYIKKCPGRVYLRHDGIAFRISGHTVKHDSMHKLYIEMKCRGIMREMCKTAGASKSVADIYNDAIIL